MSIITREELRRALKGGAAAAAPASLYLLFGAEDFLRDAAARHITDASLREGSLREFNESSFSLSSVDVQQAIAAAEQMPMMANRRVVRITDFGRLRESDEEALLRYLTRPVETTVMIFIADELDKRRKLSKTLLDLCVAVEFAPLREAELLAWAHSVLKELKTEVSEKALQQIIALAGPSARRVTNELNKLAVAALGSGQITIEMVEMLVGRSRELSNFELTDHLISRNQKAALHTLGHLLDDGAEPVMLIGLIASHYHRLALAKELMTKGASTSDVFRLVALPFSKREEFLATARRSDADHLRHCIQATARADLAIKTSQATPRLQLEILVCELLS